MKIVILANCQVEPIAKAVRFLPGVQSVLSMPIHLKGSDLFKKNIPHFEELLRDPEATILTFPLGEAQGDFSFANLKLRAKARLVKMTNVHFSGLHPDIVYIGGMGKRFESPLGDYHSRIIVKSFLEGEDAEACLQKFNAGIFGEMGFFDQFERAANELIERDKNNDIKFAEHFVELARKEPVLYTVNHPTPNVFIQYLKCIANYLGVEPLHYPPEFWHNSMAGSVWWPVYNELAEAVGLSYRMPQFFKKPEIFGGELLSLPEFIAQSFDLYRKDENLLRSLPRK